MPMTLNDMKAGMSDKVAEQVVDTFLRESEILQVLPFDNTVSPSGGSTLTYTYMQTKTPATAAFRKLNACLLYTSPSPRDGLLSRMPSSA